MKYESSEQNPNKNSRIIYILIAVILILIGTDVYMVIQQHKQADLKAAQFVDEKTRLQTELDSLETQIEQVDAGKTKITADLQAKNDSLKTKIKELRIQLAKGKLTIEELNKTQEDVKQLRYFVTKYTDDIEDLKKQNESLTAERDTLKTNLTTVSQKATTLEKQNKDLSTKVEAAAELKIANINITPLKIKGSGKEKENTRAAVVKKLKFDFTIASNSLAVKGLHDVFVRVIDPTGNLITGTDSGTFKADGQELQFTYIAPIDFKDDGSSFSVDWVNPNPFQKGVYTILFYTDGATMGKGSLTLK